MTPDTATIHNLRDQCRSYESISDLMWRNPALYRRIKRAKLDSVCFEVFPVHRRIWTVEELVKEASKYTTRSAMLADNPGLYQAIRRRKLDHLLPPSRRGQSK